MSLCKNSCLLSNIVSFGTNDFGLCRDMKGQKEQKKGLPPIQVGSFSCIWNIRGGYSEYFGEFPCCPFIVSCTAFENVISNILSESQNKMECGFFLDVIVCESPSIF